jgi:hypothetical protein
LEDRDFFQGQSICLSTSCFAFIFSVTQSLDVSVDCGAFVFRVKQNFDVSEDHAFFRVKVLMFRRPLVPLSSATRKTFTFRKIVLPSSSGLNNKTVTARDAGPTIPSSRNFSFPQIQLAFS